LKLYNVKFIKNRRAKMDVIQIEKTCRILRIVIGVVLLVLWFVVGNNWFLLGLIPLIVGVAGWRPFCKFTGKCSFKE